MIDNSIANQDSLEVDFSTLADVVVSIDEDSQIRNVLSSVGLSSDEEIFVL